MAVVLQALLWFFSMQAAAVAPPGDPFGPQFADGYGAIVAAFGALLRAHPGAISKTILLQTPEHREMALYTLGRGSSGKRILVVCNHHGDEKWVAQLCLDFVKYLLWAETRDADVGRILSRVSVDVLPLGNPDGFANRKRFNARGVDLNRNFPFQWGYEEPGSVNLSPGPEAASEPETRALRDYQLAHAGQWGAVLNYHLRYPESDGVNYLLLPWAYTRRQKLLATEKARYQFLLPTKAEAPSFTVSTVPDVFYPCGGTHTDWSYATFGAPALTLELGHGYDLPSRAEYLETYLRAENLPVFLRLLRGVERALDPIKGTGA